MDEKKFLEKLVWPHSKEDTYLEWKSTYRFCMKVGEEKDYVKESLLRSICASANNEGGRILVGYYEEQREFVGIEKDELCFDDGSLDEDLWKRSLLNKLSSFASPIASNLTKIDFFTYREGITCALIYIERADELIECPDKNGVPRIYVRQDGNNDFLEGQESIKKYENQRNKRPKNSSPKGWSTKYSSSYLDDILSLDWQRAGIVDGDIINMVPIKSGVYMFVAAQRDNSNGIFSEFKSPMYVGISEVNIRSRFKKHIKKSDFRECMRIYENKFEFYYLVLEDKSKQELEIIEQRLILKFGPSLNKINSPGQNRDEIEFV